MVLNLRFGYEKMDNRSKKYWYNRYQAVVQPMHIRYNVFCVLPQEIIFIAFINKQQFITHRRMYDVKILVR